MRTLARGCALTCVVVPLLAQSRSAPVLQWAQQISGSGQSLATASAVDSQGNLYITGNTSALDFPALSAAQAQAGGTTLTRVDAISGATQKLYAPLLSGAATFAVDPENPATLYASYENDMGDTDNSSNWTNSLIRSTDAGATWTTVGAFPSSSPGGYLLVDPTHSNVLYACGENIGVLKSTDGGMTWTAINQGISPYEGLLSIFKIWIDPNSASVLFATSPNQLYRSADGGASWSAVIPMIGSVENVAFDPFTPGAIYVSTGPYMSQKIAISTDDGQTWTPTYNAPAQFGGNVWTDPVHKGELYFTGLGANQGLFVSTDAGATWTLKIPTSIETLTFDPVHGVIYAIGFAPTIIFESSDNFNTYQPWPPAQNGNSLLVAGPSVFVTSNISTDVFVTKLDPNGNIIYSTYFGGSMSDTAAGLAVGGDGSVYVTGVTASSDFPVTKGAFLSTLPTGGQGAFVFKLNPDGSLGWSTYFSDGETTPLAIAVDSDGSPYITGRSYGDLPVTAGVLQNQAPGAQSCIGSITGCPQPATSGFLSKFKPDGSALVFSTYVWAQATQYANNQFNGIALDASGNTYLAGIRTVSLISSDGTTLMGSNTVQCQCTINALALDMSGDVYAAGYGTSFPTTSGAFQATVQPPFAPLPDAFPPQEAVIVKFDSALSQIAAATFLGGENRDSAVSLAIDSAGRVIVAGTTSSKGFPTSAPFQSSFSQNSGFVAALDPALSTLLFSTYTGDWRFFAVAGAFPDNQGHVLLAGSTLTSSPATLCVPTPCGVTGGAVFANRIALAAAPTVRLDSIENAASQLGTSITPGETITVVGSGFGAGAQLLMNGVAIPLATQTANRLTTQLPSDPGSGTVAVMTVTSGGAASNAIVMPINGASPGVYSADGSGYGQGYILNSDGTMNSPSNPAAVGSAITIFATGVGSMTESGPYAVTAQPVSIFVDGIYADGIAATLQNGMYAISVYVPNPEPYFKMPPQVPVLLVSGPVFPLNPAYSVMRSQPGIALSVAQ